jgi:polyphosphate kinase
VQIDLIVRGMCSLRPGLPGISDHIRVLSVVDRYLEHARIFYFHNNGEPLYLLASADWMQRNFDRRVEIAFPVLETVLQDRIKEILETQLADMLRGGGCSAMVITCAASLTEWLLYARKSDFMN